MYSKLTINKARKAVDLYLTGRYTYQMVADFTGVSYSLIRKLLVFWPPYDQYVSLFSSEKLQQLEQVRRERKCTVKLNPPTVRRIRRILDNGSYASKKELAARFNISVSYLGRIDRGEVHKYE